VTSGGVVATKQPRLVLRQEKRESCEKQPRKWKKKNIALFQQEQMKEKRT